MAQTPKIKKKIDEENNKVVTTTSKGFPSLENLSFEYIQQFFGVFDTW